MTLFGTDEVIEVVNGTDIYFEGKLWESFDKVELTECNGSKYLGCFAMSKFGVLVSVDAIKVNA